MLGVGVECRRRHFLSGGARLWPGLLMQGVSARARRHDVEDRRSGAFAYGGPVQTYRVPVEALREEREGVRGRFEGVEVKMLKPSRLARRGEHGRRPATDIGPHVNDVDARASGRKIEDPPLQRRLTVGAEVVRDVEAGPVQYKPGGAHHM